MAQKMILLCRKITGTEVLIPQNGLLLFQGIYRILPGSFTDLPGRDGQYKE